MENWKRTVESQIAALQEANRQQSATNSTLREENAALRDDYQTLGQENQRLVKLLDEQIESDQSDDRHDGPPKWRRASSDCNRRELISEIFLCTVAVRTSSAPFGWAIVPVIRLVGFDLLVEELD